MQDFLTTNPVEGTQVQLQVLDEVLRAMLAHSEEQDATTRLTLGETGRQRALRDALRKQHMLPIARIARRSFGVPGMDQKFRVPTERAAIESLLVAARGMAQAATQHADVFVSQAGLPSDFIDRLRAATEALAAVTPARVEGLRRRRTSRETIAKLLKRGVAVVDVLDAIVTPRLEPQPQLLEVWRSMKRPSEPGGGAVASVLPDITPVAKVA